MTAQPAFTLGPAASAFTTNRLRSATGLTPIRPRVSSRPSTIRMEEKAKEEPKSPGVKLPVVVGQAADAAKRGFDLLKEDVFKSAPEKAGVGRQDRNVTMKPMAGEPGFKPAAYQTVKVSQLGISPFTDDSNYVSRVGGIDAVVKAAQEAKKGATAKELKKKFLKASSNQEEKKPEEYDIPSYLKPIPEDTPRKGMTWKNYVGR